MMYESSSPSPKKRKSVDALGDELTQLETSARLRELEAENKRLRDESHVHEQRIKTLSEKNEILLRNISCLFKTAQEELQRKQRMIDEMAKPK